MQEKIKKILLPLFILIIGSLAVTLLLEFSFFSSLGIYLILITPLISVALIIYGLNLVKSKDLVGLKTFFIFFLILEIINLLSKLLK